jgi:hypothetical protein
MSIEKTIAVCPNDADQKSSALMAVAHEVCGGRLATPSRHALCCDCEACLRGEPESGTVLIDVLVPCLPTDEQLAITHAELDRLLAQPRRVIVSTPSHVFRSRKGRSSTREVWSVASDGGAL